MTRVNRCDPYVVLSGNITAGKSTLAGPLAQALEVPAHHERPELNPFFGSPDSHAFEAEAFFLAASARSIRSVALDGGGVVERSIREHVHVFAQARHDHGWLSRPQLELLVDLEDLLRRDTDRSPDLVVFLHVSPAAIPQRLLGRGVREELGLDPGYLQTLDRLYVEFRREWSASPICEIDTAVCDIRRPEDQADLIRQIRSLLEHSR